MVIQPRESKARASRGNPSARDVHRLRDRYLRALVRGDEEEASAVIQETVSLDWRPATIYMDVLAKAMIEVGEMWHCGELSIAHEHQSTQVTLRQASLMRQFFPPERKTGLHTVVSAVERDGHLLGAMIFSELLFFDGWSQQQLADSARIDRTYLSGAEHGKQNLTLGAVKKIADALNTPMSDFIE